MFHWDNDAEFEPSYDERTAAELEGERVQILETQIRRDERLKLRSLKLEETPGKKKLKRELRREALTRLEDAARSQSDFEEIIAWWDKLDENRERRERDHEISRGDVPLEMFRWSMVLLEMGLFFQPPFAVRSGKSFAAAISSILFLTVLMRCTKCWQILFCQRWSSS